jgi:hypothetical protein
VEVAEKHAFFMQMWVNNIWVILSCTEGWGKDVCLVPGELNEMHRYYMCDSVLYRELGKDVCLVPGELNEMHRYSGVDERRADCMQLLYYS